MALVPLLLAKTQQQCNGGSGDGGNGSNGGRCHHNCCPCGLQQGSMATAMATWPLQLTMTSLADGGGGNGSHCC
jgi:hypothetical protein